MVDFPKSKVPPLTYVCRLCGLQGMHYANNCPHNVLTQVRQDLRYHSDAAQATSRNHLKKLVRQELFKRLRSKKRETAAMNTTIDGNQRIESEENEEAEEEKDLAKKSQLLVEELRASSGLPASLNPPINDGNLSPSEGPTLVVKEKARDRFEEMRKRAMELTNQGQRIALDLTFGDLMNGLEVHSLKVQIAAGYGACLRAREPGRLVLTSLKDQMKDSFAKISGIDDWAVDRHERHFTEVFSDEIASERLVYLTPDAGETLQEVKKSHVYVIGGFVDRVPQKGVTLERARRLGIRAARLPLKEFVRLKRNDRLPINQVVQLLLLVGQHVDWAEAIKMAVPLYQSQTPKSS